MENDTRTPVEAMNGETQNLANTLRLVDRHLCSAQSIAHTINEALKDCPGCRELISELDAIERTTTAAMRLVGGMGL